MPTIFDQLELHEGSRGVPYDDATGLPVDAPVGVITIGVGRNLQARPLTPEERRFLLHNDVWAHERELLAALPWVAQLDPIRKRVLLDMAFNLGVPKLLHFTPTLALIKAGRYHEAAQRMLRTLWAQQVGKGDGQRAWRLAQMMDTGKDYTR